MVLTIATTSLVVLFIIQIVLMVLSFRQDRKSLSKIRQEVIDAKNEVDAAKQEASQQQFLEVISRIGLVINNHKEMDELVKGLPQKVLESIRGSASNLRGDLGEYIQLLKLKADYDIIMPMGDIVDYICIKFPDEETGFLGALDFVEVKTGNSRLSQSQKKVRSVIQNKAINFKQVLVRLNDIKE